MEGLQIRWCKDNVVLRDKKSPIKSAFGSGFGVEGMVERWTWETPRLPSWCYYNNTLGDYCFSLYVQTPRWLHAITAVLNRSSVKRSANSPEQRPQYPQAASQWR